MMICHNCGLTLIAVVAHVFKCNDIGPQISLIFMKLRTTMSYFFDILAYNINGVMKLRAIISYILKMRSVLSLGL